MNNGKTVYVKVLEGSRGILQFYDKDNKIHETEAFIGINGVTKEKVESYLRTFAVIASSSLLELPGDYNSEETTQLAEDIIMNNGEKGVTWTSNYDTRNIEFTLTATK